MKCPEKIQLISQGNINFKNVLESAEIFEVLPAIEKKEREIYIDPVCHIRLSADEIHISLLDGEDEYFSVQKNAKRFSRSTISV